MFIDHGAKFENIDSLGLGKNTKFCLVTDSSQRAKIQSVVSKAKSLFPSYGNDFAKLESILNGIPWKFLGFVPPKDLMGTST